MSEVGDRLRDARVGAGLTQSELARRAGVHQPSISAFERGSSEPRPETVRRLLEATRERPSVVLQRLRDEVLAAATRSGVSHVRVFGSAVHGTDTIASDIDLLVHFGPGSSLIDLSRFADDVESVLGFAVDVVADDSLGGDIGRRIADEAVAL